MELAEFPEPSRKTQRILLCLLYTFLPLTACKSDADKARLMFNQAQVLIRQESQPEAKKILNELVAKYGHTKEATEANQLLMSLKVADEAWERVAETWRQALLTALTTFRLDCRRYPTPEEGLKALLVNPGFQGWRGPYWRLESAHILDKFEYKHRGDYEEPEVSPRMAKR